MIIIYYFKTRIISLYFFNCMQLYSQKLSHVLLFDVVFLIIHMGEINYLFIYFFYKCQILFQITPFMDNQMIGDCQLSCFRFRFWYPFNFAYFSWQIIMFLFTKICVRLKLLKDHDECTSVYNKVAFKSLSCHICNKLQQICFSLS